MQRQPQWVDLDVDRRAYRRVEVARILPFVWRRLVARARTEQLEAAQ